MLLSLPSLSENRLDSLFVCAAFEADDLLTEWLRSEGEIHARVRYGDNCVCMLACEILDDGKFHLHFDLATDKHFSKSESLKDYTAEELSNSLEKIAGRTICATIGAYFSVKRDAIPKWGMLSSLLDVTTESCGANLSLTGAKMAIEDPVFRRISWNLADDFETLCLSIEAVEESIVDDAYLSNAVAIATRGLDCFVFESDVLQGSAGGYGVIANAPN